MSSSSSPVLSALVPLALAAIMALATPAAAGRTTGTYRPSTGFPATPVWWRNQWNYQKMKQQYIAGIDKAGIQLDVVLYGDSIIQVLERGAVAGTNEWQKYFGGLDKSAPMGVLGNNAENLAWRLMKGGELPKKCPKVVALYIGLTQGGLSMEETASTLEKLVVWLKKTCPATRPVVMALLPAKRKDTKPYNVLYAAMAKRQRVTFANCGQNMSPDNPNQLYDGEHPATEAQNALITCLYRYVKGFL